MSFWGCSKRFSGSGRPSRLWTIETSGPDVCPDDKDENGRPYPFNGMGGAVECGPFDSAEEAEKTLNTLVFTDAAGYLQWT